ncbi:MAG: hypothetical protein KJO70_03015, partial [Gammaproteobacteria bacterium]|nr:hypothetical protein [Gammaproteobacteria bacterium]
MNAKFLAACAAALLVLPLAAQAASGVDATTLAKSGKGPATAKAGPELVSPEDFIEYASINDV